MQSPERIRAEGAHFRYRGDQAWRYLSYLILVAPGNDAGEDRQSEEVFDMGSAERADAVFRAFVLSALEKPGL
jgi:hypothetical protein